MQWSPGATLSAVKALLDHLSCLRLGMSLKPPGFLCFYKMRPHTCHPSQQGFSTSRQLTFGARSLIAVGASPMRVTPSDLPPQGQ